MTFLSSPLCTSTSALTEKEALEEMITKVEHKRGNKKGKLKRRFRKTFAPLKRQRLRETSGNPQEDTEPYGNSYIYIFFLLLCIS